MKFAITPTTGSRCHAKRRSGAGFTFAEVLAALAFLAIVIPVTLEALRIGNRASVVAERKLVAAQVADRVLNEIIVTRGWSAGTPNGTWEDEGKRYQWNFRTDPWPIGALRLVTVEVLFVVQERQHSVQVSTLIDDSVTI